MLKFAPMHLRIFSEVTGARLLDIELIRLNLSLRLYLREFICVTEVGCLILLYGIPFLATRFWEVLVHHGQRRLIFVD